MVDMICTACHWHKVIVGEDTKPEIFK